MVCICHGIHAQNIDSYLKAKPLELTGSLSANGGLSSINGTETDRTSPFHYGLNARLNIKIYGINTPIYFSYRDHSFSLGASLYKLRLNPQYKWVKLHIGDTYMKFNPYTLAGRNVRGYGVELTPGKFRAKFLSGKIQDLNSYKDTLAFGTIEEQTFTRNTLAASIGYGSASNSIDLYAVKTKDSDSLEVSQIEDASRLENVVVGTSLRIRPTKGVRLQFNAGLSALTDLEVIDENETRTAFTYNSSTNYTYAGDVSTSFQIGRTNLNGKVKYIQAFFDPLTTQYVNNDLINYTLGLTLPLAKNRIYLNGSVGIQNNNLTKQKASTANRIILNLLANFRVTKSITTNFRYTNFQQDFQAEVVELGNEFNYVVTSRNLLGSFKYRSAHPTRAFHLGLTAGRQTFTNVSDEEINNQYQSLNTNLSIGLNFKEADLNITSGVNYRDYTNDISNNENLGTHLRINKKFADKKFNVSYRSAYILTYKEGLRNGNTLRNNVRLGYIFSKKNALNLQLGHIRRTTPFSESFKEFRTNLSFNTNF